jgi:hypothetical protein
MNRQDANVRGNVCPYCGSYKADTPENIQSKMRDQMREQLIKEGGQEQVQQVKNTSSFSDTSGSANSYSNNPSRNSYRYAKMHWLYFLLIGWWLGLTMACLIIPLFIRGFVKKSFGYW